MEGQTEEILADQLLDRIRGTDFSIDELLALLAYTLHEETALLMKARDEGASVGDVGNRACDLKRRSEDVLL